MYEKQDWSDVYGETPFNADRMKHIEDGIYKNSQSNVYSTDEVFTGKYWIDGKKIYKKVINVGTYTFSNGDNKFAHGISNFKRAININYSMFFAGGNQWYTYWSTIVGKIATSSDVILSTNGSNTFNDLEITIEYTKTTD